MSCCNNRFVLQEEWAVFHFHSDNSLYRVPRSWIASSWSCLKGKTHKSQIASACWWPNNEDEKNLSALITNYSDPDVSKWSKLPGVLIGIYDSLEVAERELKKRDGTLPTDSETIHDEITNTSNCSNTVQSTASDLKSLWQSRDSPSLTPQRSASQPLKYRLSRQDAICFSSPPFRLGPLSPKHCMSQQELGISHQESRSHVSRLKSRSRKCHLERELILSKTKSSLQDSQTRRSPHDSPSLQSCSSQQDSQSLQKKDLQSAQSRVSKSNSSESQASFQGSKRYVSRVSVPNCRSPQVHLSIKDLQSSRSRASHQVSTVPHRKLLSPCLLSSQDSRSPEVCLSQPDSLCDSFHSKSPHSNESHPRDSVVSCYSNGSPQDANRVLRDNRIVYHETETDHSHSDSDILERKITHVWHLLKEMTEKQASIECKVDQLLRDTSKFSSNKLEDSFIEDSGKPYTIAIEKMSSSKPEIRRQVNKIRCLQDLGFPVTSSVEELEERHTMLEGDDVYSIRRRNALTNALTTMIPDETRRTVSNSVRSCLYAIAPSALWQFYSGHGMAGSNKRSFSDTLPLLSKAVLLAVSEVTEADQPTVKRHMSEVLKTMHTRKSAAEYRERHPIEVCEIMGTDSKTLFAKKKRRDIVSTSLQDSADSQDSIASDT